MAESDKVTLIPLDLSTEWQPTKIANDMHCYTDYPIPKDVPLLAIFKPPDPDSNWCEMNFRLRQLPKEPDHLIGNRF